MADLRWLSERLGRVGEGTARPLLSPVTRAGRRQCQVAGRRRERERGATQRERVCGRGGFRVPSPNAGPLLFGILFPFFFVVQKLH